LEYIALDVFTVSTVSVMKWSICSHTRLLDGLPARPLTPTTMPIMSAQLMPDTEKALYM